MTESAKSIDPERAILLVMDYQPGILSRLPNGDGLVAHIAKVIAMVRSKGMHVGYVRVAFADEDYEAVPEHNERFKQIAKTKMMHHEDPTTAVHSDIAPEPGDVVVRKTRVGAFSTTDLDKQLKQRKIDTLVLAGISTSGVVLSTVRDAADRDYRVYVLEDGSADPDPEVHAVLTQKVFPNQARVISSDDLRDLLGAR